MLGVVAVFNVVRAAVKHIKLSLNKRGGKGGGGGGGEDALLNVYENVHSDFNFVDEGIENGGNDNIEPLLEFKEARNYNSI